MNVYITNLDGSKGSALKVSDSVFKIEPNESVVHQAVVAELHNRRQGTHAAKSRGMVSGGGKKPWKQKGRGVARAGTIRSPLWKGGGTVFGPEPHPYKKRIPKKMRKLARKSILSYKVKNNQIVVLDEISLSKPKTASFCDLLVNLKLNGKKVLVLPSELTENLRLSVRNISNVDIKVAGLASTYDLLNYNILLFDKSGLLLLNEKLSS